ncbi:TIGR04348 family glycosyltransferase [Betaproteobacteria bacterium PRO7]|jgi:putative glycosyltransferase (TIGR04348 family)|nr:TIGR04348 family glycosyltransferase [Betaproteobacteria bacterium PRO7]
MPSVLSRAARPRRPLVAIITPSLADANTGNWHTAARWARFLRARYRVRVLKAWNGEAADALIALHARRSAASIEAFARHQPRRPLIVVLTGTDLYRDIRTDAAAQRSLELATRLVVLQERGAEALPAALRGKAVVIYQSAPRLALGVRRRTMFDVAVVGHLRDEKDPRLAMRVAERLPHDSRIRVLHVGDALDPALGQAAQSTQRRCARYRWLGGLPRARTRQVMRNARLLLHPSKMEGGAQAILEAIQSGTPVVASDCPGNVGMLGRGYPGLFPVGDMQAAAKLLRRAETDAKLLRALQSACKKRAALFDPERERRAVLRLVDNSLAKSSRRSR